MLNRTGSIVYFMPSRRIYIPVNAIPELEKHGFRLPSTGYFEDCEYYVFASKKGDIGAILSRCGIREKLGYCVNFVQEMGGYVEDLYNDDPLSNESRQLKPQQLAFEEIFRQAPYDESSHLTPNGERKRR